MNVTRRSTWTPLRSQPVSEISPRPSAVAAVDVRQVVARNIRHLREIADLTQEELAQRLNSVSGGAWTNVAVSQVEAGWKSGAGRVRQVDLNELIAFSIVFEVPIWALLLPPR